ncbi:DUF397 domain-containing protein [Nonomuraea sp. NPDC046570]|uniref:DUF397 domain-containing protein n=1 Tax=Nonomuraea sp. NPDC046570 TaxID=3155255 RepID=UPI0033E4FB4A
MANPELSHAEWRTSSRSGGNGECVSVAFVRDDVAVRDSKNPDGPVLVFTHAEWSAFLGGVHDGEFELPVPAHAAQH